jgi:hypothetical protein
MKHRIAIWAGTGFLVACCWALYAFLAAPFTNQRMQDVWIVLAAITCPITLGSHHPIGLSWVLLANAATYALAGFTVEMLRRNQRRTQPQSQS